MNFVATPLLVWVLADTYVKKEGVKTATKKDAISLLNLAWNLSDCREAVETLSRNLNLAMRNIAIQQFEHQENLLRQDFSRTWLIFRDLQASSRLRKCFEEATNLSVEDALALVLMFSLAFGSFSSPKNDLRNLVRSALERCPKFVVTLRAFDGMSLRSQIAVRHTAASIYAPSPFVRYPLLQLGKNLQVVDNHLAGRTAEMYAYRIIEEFGGPREKQQLTQCTEKYVNKLAKKNFDTMVWLGDEVTQIAGPGLSCDQVVRVSEHLVLLVEIKAAQLSSEKIISLSEDFLFSVLQQTVIKGYEQLAATKVRLVKRDLSNQLTYVFHWLSRTKICDFPMEIRFARCYLG